VPAVYKLKCMDKLSCILSIKLRSTRTRQWHGRVDMGDLSRDRKNGVFMLWRIGYGQATIFYSILICLDILST
jgi:hypothetical protein